MRVTRHTHPVTMDARVALPDHLDGVRTLPEGDEDFSTRWRLIKSIFARRVPVVERRSETRLRSGERGIWQRRIEGARHPR